MATRAIVAMVTVAALTAVGFVDRVVIVPAAAQDRVTTLLAQVHTALGGSAALAAVKAISAEGPYRRVAGTRTRDSLLTLLLVRPDKLRRSEESRFFTTTERITTFDGAQVWDEVASTGAGVGGGHGGFDHGGGGHVPDGGASADHGGWDHDGHSDDAQTDATDAGGALTADQLAAARVRRMRMDLQRWTLAFLADTDRPFTSAGRAESPDGPADLLETTDEAGRTVHYLIDPATHLPLVVQYQQTRAAAPVVVGPRPPASPPAKLSTIAMHLSAFKQVAGVMVPHQIDIAVDGRAAEAWTIESVTINPKIKPSTFKRAVK